MKPLAAVAARAPQPYGDLACSSIASIARLASALPAEDVSRSARYQWGEATRAVLEYLVGFPGESWQERWDASSLGQGSVDADTVSPRRSAGGSIAVGMRALYCLRVIQPSLLAFRRTPLTRFGTMFIASQDDPGLLRYVQAVHAQPLRHAHQRDALTDMCTLLASQGVAFSDVTAPTVLHFTHENRRARSTLQPGNQVANRLAGHSMWHVLHTMGHFPAATPKTMKAALLRGQRSIEELVGRYPIRNQGVRQLLIDYLTRRRADTDYASIKALALSLAHHFWEKIEQINPGQADLRISPENYATWRQMITVTDAGTERIGQDAITLAVRSFYYDLHTWAAAEPECFAVWVAPCPVPLGELRGMGVRRRRITERSADRTRQRQHLLPALVDHVQTRYDVARHLLQRAERAQAGEVFEHNGTAYERVLSESDHKLLRRGDSVPTRVKNLDSGQVVYIATEEEAAFWDWACIETLRHSGVRLEELCELSHPSVRQYRRDNGEVIALLVVAPSKTDRERVIPMSAELFHVVASIIRRQTRTGRTIPLTSRYDTHDKVWSPPMPFLFQRLAGSGPKVYSTGAIQQMIRRRCEALAETHPGFRGMKFTPHDFRRIFATELVNSGLPIHIGAALLGHLDIQTTRGYVAVFDEDIVRHYQQHLNQRRQTRPTTEYDGPTPEEWTEFEEHFDRRRVELGSCDRPYGTPCQHEHACIRCPMLRINPKMLPRLEELEADLQGRLQRATEEAWLGEIEGIKLTLVFLQGKRDEALRLSHRPKIDLGMPKPRTTT